MKKIPKKAHFYWGGERLSFLRWMTLKSFRIFNPDWEIILHRPTIPFHLHKTWTSPQQGEAFIGNNYEDLLPQIGY